MCSQSAFRGFIVFVSFQVVGYFAPYTCDRSGCTYYVKNLAWCNFDPSKLNPVAHTLLRSPDTHPGAKVHIFIAQRQQHSRSSIQYSSWGAGVVIVFRAMFPLFSHLWHKISWSPGGSTTERYLVFFMHTGYNNISARFNVNAPDGASLKQKRSQDHLQTKGLSG